LKFIAITDMAKNNNSAKEQWEKLKLGPVVDFPIDQPALLDLVA